MRIADQRLIKRWWVDYVGDEEPTNALLREFYIDVVRPSDLYYYGIVFEVFDLLTNGVFEYRAAVAVDPTPQQDPAQQEEVA